MRLRPVRSRTMKQGAAAFLPCSTKRQGIPALILNKQAGRNAKARCQLADVLQGQRTFPIQDQANH